MIRNGTTSRSLTDSVAHYDAPTTRHLFSRSKKKGRGRSDHLLCGAAHRCQHLHELGATGAGAAGAGARLSSHSAKKGPLRSSSSSLRGSFGPALGFRMHIRGAHCVQRHIRRLTFRAACAIRGGREPFPLIQDRALLKLLRGAALRLLTAADNFKTKRRVRPLCSAPLGAVV